MVTKNRKNKQGKATHTRATGQKKGHLRPKTSAAAPATSRFAQGRQHRQITRQKHMVDKTLNSKTVSKAASVTQAHADTENKTSRTKTALTGPRERLKISAQNPTTQNTKPTYGKKETPHKNSRNLTSGVTNIARPRLNNKDTRTMPNADTSRLTKTTLKACTPNRATNSPRTSNATGATQNQSQNETTTAKIRGNSANSQNPTNTATMKRHATTIARTDQLTPRVTAASTAAVISASGQTPQLRRQEITGRSARPTHIEGKAKPKKKKTENAVGSTPRQPAPAPARGRGKPQPPRSKPPRRHTRR
ncbi:hypothetical protein SAMN02745178_00028 [Gemmiger formicilis]|uniref:Uncharacterized protein n=1 Tax=Gemmiger formicilis TaxID=745368 RepID=A0A1T4W778_9FIRM|nr:hypothetical protein SAMN02745178_00028 [Gemmiger formicilis]